MNEPKVKLAKNKYYALRHGESDKNVPVHLVISYPEPKPYHLTEHGREQVAKAAKWLKGKNIDFIFSSDLTRTKDTAEIASKALGAEVIYDERLRELDFGVYNGKTVEEYRSFFKDHDDAAERFRRAPEGGDNLQQVTERMLDFLKSIESKYEGKNILIISHGDPLLMLEWGSQCLSIEALKDVHYHKTGEPGEMKITCPIE